jgi:hypothetical protein
MNIFRKKKKAQFYDYDGKPLKIGDNVMSLRYDLGKCTIVQGEKSIEYKSLETGKSVRSEWMIDAHTENQKVRKLDE